jgi:hypothetical protein
MSTKLTKFPLNVLLMTNYCKDMQSLLSLNVFAGNHVIIANGPAITEENHVTSTTKLSRCQKAVPESLAYIGTGEAHMYRPSVRGATTFSRSNRISSVKDPMPKRESFIAK